MADGACKVLRGPRVWRWLGAVALLVLAGCASQNDVRTESDETDADKRARVRVELAAAYFSRGQYTTALDEVKQALVVKPESTEALNLRGLIYGAMNEPELAEESFRRSLSVNRRNGDTLHNFGWFLCQRKRYADADTQFQAALALPNYRDAGRTQLVRGVCQARNQQWAEAERSLLHAFELEPGNPAINVNLAEVLLRRGELERARFYVRRVNASDELVNPQSLWLAIRIERKLGQTMVVRALGRQLTTQFAKSPEAQLFEKGQFDEQ